MDGQPDITQDWGAWALSRVGIAIDAVVDRELREAYEPNRQLPYGVGPTGQLYQLGRPAPAAQVPQAGFRGMMTPQNLAIAAAVGVLLVLLLRK